MTGLNITLEDIKLMRGIIEERWNYPTSLKYTYEEQTIESIKQEFNKIKNTMKEYKGDLKGFPEEVVEWMLDMQMAQGNRADMTVFERNKCTKAIDGGFSWFLCSKEYPYEFCVRVIKQKEFDLFFKKHPEKKKQCDEPFKERVMLVCNDGLNWKKRVVFMKKAGRYLAWANDETIEKSESTYDTVAWIFVKELESEEQIVELTMEDISNGKGVGVKPELIRIKK